MVSATVDTAALRHNLQVVRARARNSRVMAVVKANAYGHGLVAVAKALNTADAFAVARIEEGMALRAAGIVQPILLLGGVFDRGQMDIAAAQRFELLVHSAQQIELLKAAPASARFTVWLKLDTGMNRLGLKAEEFLSARALLEKLPSVDKPVRLFTHMANADTPSDAATQQQIQLFDSVTAGLPGARSLANSAALLAFPESRCDWVRPGLLLYGASPFANEAGADHALRPVMTLRSHVIAVKELKAGEAVGYGGVWTALGPTRLAIASVGYGDGYPRNVGRGVQVLVNGSRAALIGRVSMDMIGIDVTRLPAPHIGDEVILWGEGLPVEEIATFAGTIAYELLCGISQRVAVDVR